MSGTDARQLARVGGGRLRRGGAAAGAFVALAASLIQPAPSPAEAAPAPPLAAYDRDHPGIDYSGDAAHKRWRDIWAAGQGLQKVGAVEPTAVVVERLEAEYRAAATRFAGLTAPRSAA